MFVLGGRQCRLTIAAALNHDDFESGSGGRCPQTIAAALSHIEIESEATQFLPWFGKKLCSQFGANRVGKRLDLLCSAFYKSDRTLNAIAFVF